MLSIFTEIGVNYHSAQIENDKNSAGKFDKNNKSTDYVSLTFLVIHVAVMRSYIWREVHTYAVALTPNHKSALSCPNLHPALSHF